MGIISILIAILVFCVVVVIHELGHFWAARKVGILVEEFSIGMGPRLLSFKPGETRYSLKLFPIGGSCRMLGEVEEETEEDEAEESVSDPEKDKSRSFMAKPVRSRMFVILAGVVMNLILAVVFSVLLVFINNFTVPEIGSFVVQIEAVSENSRAYEAGFRVGDRIRAVNGEMTHYQNEFWRQIDRSVNYVDVDRVVERISDGETIRSLERAIIQIVGGTAETLGIALNEESLAQQAGMQPGDRITHINGSRIRTHDDFRFFMHFTDGAPLTFDFIRAGENHQVVIQPYFNEARQTYLIGFIPGERLSFSTRITDENSMHQRAGFFESVSLGVHNVSFYVRSALTGLSRLVTGRMNINEFGGPVMMVSTISDTTEASFTHGGVRAAVWNSVWWAAFISSNLFIFNLLPIPMLDGGKMVFLTIEAIRRKPINPEKEGLIHLAGFVLLIGFALFVTFNDVMRFFQ